MFGKSGNPSGGPGGHRPGAGRPKGSVNKFAKEAVEKARESGILPHEFLLSVARGEPIEQKRWEITTDENGNEIGRELVTDTLYPDFDFRLDAAKAAAPYYAPRLSAQAVNLHGGTEAIAEALMGLAERLPV
jgi:hypothetical protein